jgi:hypothetical protein
VMVPPPAGSPAQNQRLPIFDSLESDWFRRSGQTLNSGPAEKSAAQSWSSPADEGMRAAGAESSGETVAPSRSADDIRSRMSSFQRGVRDARAAAPQNEEP